MSVFSCRCSRSMMWLDSISFSIYVEAAGNDRNVIWCGIVSIFRTAAYKSKLPSPGNKAASPNSMAHGEFFKGMAASRFGRPKLPGGFRHLRTCGDSLPCCRCLQQDSKRRQCQENLIQHRTILHGHFLSQP